MDGTLSVDWIDRDGRQALNLLTKGSERHCRGQLRMTPEQHRKRIADVLAYARKRKVKVNVYLEDWSQGVSDSPDYVFAMMRTLTENPVERIYLADTLGILAPKDTARFVDLMVASWPDMHFEFHGHNDYGLATANCLAAVEAGARGVHTSVNGMGERAGNTRLAEVVAALHDHRPFAARAWTRSGWWRSRASSRSSAARTSRRTRRSSAATCSRRPPASTPTATRRATSTQRGSRPRASVAQRRYALGKLSGKASLDQNLKALGIELARRDTRPGAARIVELGDKKHTVMPEDLPLHHRRRAEDAARAARAHRVVRGDGRQRRRAVGAT